MVKYILFRINGKVVFSIPCAPSAIRKNAFKYFQGMTYKRKLFRIGVRFLTKFNLEKMIAHDSTTPVPMHSNFDFDGWLKKVEEVVGLGELKAIVSFPSQDSRKRFYVHLFSEDAQNIAFAKISLDSVNDIFLLNEYTNIKELCTDNYSFKVPRIMSTDIYQSHRYILFEAMPYQAKKINSTWDETAKNFSMELKKNTVNRKTLNEMSWVHNFQKEISSKDSKRFFEKIKIKNNELLEVCFAHGDMQNSNICYFNDEVWLFDWESACSDAPVMTDEISFYLGTVQRKVVESPSIVFTELKRMFLAGKDEKTVINVGLAIAYLCTMGRQDAKTMISNWDFTIDKSMSST